jgi:dipeptidase E
MRLFLTSTVDAVAHDIAKRIDITSGNTLVFIDTAAEPEIGDKQWLKDDRQSLVDAGFAVTDYTITNKTEDQLFAELKVYDYIYLSGGNTFYLLQQSIKSGFIPVVRKLIIDFKKTYIGTSAGSIIAGPKLQDYLIEADDPLVKSHEGAQAYGLVNFTILPHWGSELFRKLYLEGRLEIAYKKDQVPLVLLTDSQYVLVEDEVIQFIDVNKKSN